MGQDGCKISSTTKSGLIVQQGGRFTWAACSSEASTQDSVT